MVLNIEELIVRGVAPGDRRRLTQDVQAELSQLMAEQGGPPQPGGFLSPRGRPSGSRKTGGDSVARQIARGIYQNLAGGQ